MPFGLLTGLAAALSWGTLDVITALASRVIGSLRVTAGMQFASAIIFVSLAIISGTQLPTEPGSFAIAALLGFIGAGAYLAYFTGLQFGPISVVSGVVAAFGGLTVVLSVVFRGESLTTIQAAGATIATIGVVLTGIAFEGGWRATRFAGPGVVFSIVALVLFSLMTMVTDIALETMEWLQVYALARGINAATSIAVLVVLARQRSWTATGRWASPGPTPRIVGAIVVAGVARRARAHRVRDRPRIGPDVDGRPGRIVRSGGHDPRRGRVPRRAPQADPVVRSRRCGDWDDRDRPAERLAREAEPDARLAVARFGPDSAARRLDELLDDRETDPGTAARPVARLLDPVEAVEHALQFVRRDPVAGVDDRDEEVSGPSLGTDRDRAAGRGVAGRVREQVGQHLGQAGPGWPAPATDPGAPARP